MNPLIRYSLLSFSFFCLIGCHPIKYASSDGEDSSIPVTNQDTFREGFKYFTDNLSSDKLDLVIVLDVQEGMETFYKENIFDLNFLDHFKEFDWRVAYTNTSISNDFLKKFDNEEEVPDNCKGLISGGFNSFITGALLESPFLLLTGLNSFSKCVSVVRKKRKQKRFPIRADGDFLQFELDGKQVSLNGNYLTKGVEGYNNIFNDTMVFRKRSKWGWSKSYEAPVIQGNDSYPLLSVLLSFSKKINALEGDKFFREDSRIVYVVITPEDGKIDITESGFKKSLKDFLSGKNRFQLIPVTIKEQNFQICKIKFTEVGLEKIKPARILQNLAESLDVQPVDICSSDLGEDLAKEIKAHLHSTGVL